MGFKGSEVQILLLRPNFNYNFSVLGISIVTFQKVMVVNQQYHPIREVTQSKNEE